MNTRFRRSFRVQNEFDADSGGGGGFADGGDAGQSDDSGAGEPAASSGEATPASAFDAMWNRDEQGRFAPKPATPAEPGAPTAPAPVVAGQPAPAPVAPLIPEDPLAMPEGLQPKAQERFQALANTNKELSAKVEAADQQLSYIRETFQQHAVRQDQFEQAASVIGMLNTGNLRGALQVLDDQRRQIALALGEPVPGVDVLSGHDDLRAAVDGLQITEQHAAELARARAVQQAQQRQQTQQREQTQQAEQTQAAVRDGTLAVDSIAKRLQASDPDYAAIEAKLMPVVGEIFKGVPPSRWASIFQTQYNLIKQVAGSARSGQPAPGVVLRPTGQGAPAARPNSAFEAMWGAPAPRA